MKGDKRMLTGEENRKIPVVASYIGTMLAANDKNGIPHKNWRKIFVTSRGVIEIRKSDILKIAKTSKR